MIEATVKQNIFSQWFKWRYKEVPKNILRAWANFLKFNFNFFSIKLLLKTLFSHWRRYKEPYERGFSPSKWAYVFIGNTISRLIGALIMTAVILLGLLMEAATFGVGAAIFVFWLFLPLIIVIFFWTGLHLLLF